MRTTFKIALAGLLTALMAAGCADRSRQDRTARHRAPLERKQRIDAALEELSDAFEVVWDSVEVKDNQNRRGMLSVDVDEDLLYVTTDDGLLFVVDGLRGRMRAAYIPGSSQPITPPVISGSYLGTDFIYLVHDNCIHAIDRPRREGLLTPAWVARHDGIIATPLCETANFLFFGDRNQRAYAVLKAASNGRNDIRLIDKFDARMKAAPITMSRIDRPFFVDTSGSLYRFDGRFSAVLEPLLKGLGTVEAPMLVDAPTATLLVASDNYKLYAINVNNPRSIMWTGELGSKPAGTMYIYDRAVYVLNEDGELRAFHLDKTEAGIAGKPLWDGRPVFNVKSIISKGKENTLYVLRAGSRIGKLDTASGRVVWERAAPRVDYMPVNRYNSTIYLGIKEGWLWAIKPR
ncbi:MAG: hypothetical protein DRP79_04315 [Planctomycetota bacterium]|nr:MAG: hypothetical protein DRP79_04315 [Planctomycetota bacterium]